MIRNIYELNTPYGRKSIELHHADLVNMDMAVDVLVTSAYRGDYSPVPGTLIGGLAKILEEPVASLAAAPLIDMRPTLGVWMSGPLENEHLSFRYLLCTELLSREQNEAIDDSIRGIFALIAYAEVTGLSIKSIAMPLLGAGSQGLAPSVVLPAMLEVCHRGLNSFSALERIYLVERNEGRLDEIDQAFDRQYGRDALGLPKLAGDEFSIAVKRDLADSLKVLADVLGNEGGICNEICDELNGACRFFNVAALSRRLAEGFCRVVTKNRKVSKDLLSAIDKTEGLPAWIKSYLHTIRIMGNLSVHDGEAVRDDDRHMDNEEFLLLLLCLNRVALFWVSQHREDPD